MVDAESDDSNIDAVVSMSFMLTDVLLSFLPFDLCAGFSNNVAFVDQGNIFFTKCDTVYFAGFPCVIPRIYIFLFSAGNKKK